MKISKPLLPVLLILGSLVFTLVLLEVLFRAYIAYGKKPALWNDRPAFFYKDPLSSTLQDYAYSKEKPNSTYRIAVIGDSFTFATDMQFDDSFPKKLEKMLNLNRSGENVEVINYGVPGYSTSHEVGTVKNALAEQADLVLLQITLNDPQFKPFRPSGLTADNPFVESPQTNQGVMKHLRLASFIKKRLHDKLSHSAYVEYYFDLFDNKKNWTSFSHSLRKIIKICRKNNVSLGVVVFPLFGLPLDDNYPFHPLHNKISQLTKTADVPTLDLFETYHNIPLSRIQVIPNRDFHPNEIGHRLAAEAIYQWLISEKLISSRYQIEQRFEKRINIHPENNSPIYSIG